MIYQYYGQANPLTQLKHCGDEIWACAFEEAQNRTARKLAQKPVRGILTHYNNELAHNSMDLSVWKPIRYFVPYGKNGKPVWSRAVQVGSRLYADTEDECRMAYDSAVLSAVIFHLKQADEILQNTVGTDNAAKAAVMRWHPGYGPDTLPKPQSGFLTLLEGIGDPPGWLRSMGEN